VPLKRADKICGSGLLGRSNRIAASPRPRVSVSQALGLFDEEVNARRLFRVSGDRSVLAHFLVKDVTTPRHGLDNLLCLIAQRATYFHQALHQRIVRDRCVNPHGLDQFIFADESPIVFDEILQDLKRLGAQLDVIVNQTGWEQVLENNKQAFTAEFVQRARFTSALPTSMTPTEFVDKLFANADMTPAAAERADAINEFGSATNTADTSARARALRRVAENSTLAQQEFNRAFVLMQYFGYLRRNPNDPPELTLDFQGYNFWLGKLNQFNGDYIAAEMVKAFIVSTEYRQRFGQP